MEVHILDNMDIRVTSLLSLLFTDTYILTRESKLSHPWKTNLIYECICLILNVFYKMIQS